MATEPCIDNSLPEGQTEIGARPQDADRRIRLPLVGMLRKGLLSRWQPSCALVDPLPDFRQTIGFPDVMTAKLLGSRCQSLVQVGTNHCLVGVRDLATASALIFQKVESVDIQHPDV
jgi:hypothetical protein